MSIDAAITRTDPGQMGELSPEAQGRSQALYSFLSGLVKGRLLSVLRSPSLVVSSNGFEALRLIHQEIEPSTGAASIGLLETILAMPEPPKGTPLRDSILAIERLFEDYEVSSTEKLSENLKIATLRKLLPAELKVHATLLVKDGVAYDQVKKAVTEYEVADRSFQHICPASFAEWIKPVAHSSGPRLRDAQGKAMQHGNKYRTVTLCVKTTEGNELGIPVTFLIGPVQQPILSTGRLEDDMRANLDIKNRHFECGRHKIQVDRIMRSYHLPAWVDRPTEDNQVERIRQVKRLEVQGDVVKFRFKSRQAEPVGARTEPSLASRREERPVTPERERSRGRSRQPRRRRGKSPASMPMASRPATAAKGEVPKFPSGPPPAAPTQSLDVQYGRESRRMKAILEKEDWISAGPQYLGQDGVPSTFKLYFGTRLQGPTKDSKKVDRAVCECGKVLKPNEGSLWSHLYAKHCVPEVMWKIWDVEYKVRREESPEQKETPKAGLLRLPQRHPEGLRSQEVNQWFSGPLKRGPRKGSERRSLMTMRTSGARLTATGSLEGTGVQHHGTMTLRVRRKKSRSNQRLTEQPDGNGQR